MNLQARRRRVVKKEEEDELQERCKDPKCCFSSTNTDINANTFGEVTFSIRFSVVLEKMDGNTYENDNKYMLIGNSNCHIRENSSNNTCSDCTVQTQRLFLRHFLLEYFMDW